MRVAVTGSTGFIGRALCAQLLESGNEVVGVAARGMPSISSIAA